MSVHPLATVAPVWIDHVVLAVADLEKASDQLAGEHGLGSYPAPPPAGSIGLGGRIVPCGSGYLQLLAVQDHAGATGHSLGAAVVAALEEGRLLVSWAVATDQIEAFSRRNGLDPTSDEVRAADGALLRRRVLGAEVALGGVLPAVVSWDDPEKGHPERQPVGHRVDPIGITCLELAAQATRLRSWLGPAVHDLPIKICRGAGGLHAVTVATAAGDLNIGNRDRDGPWPRRQAVLDIGGAYGQREEPRPSSEASRWSSSSTAVVR